jgi:hypothetical protein
MPYISYGGLRYNQTRHAIYCKKCEETIESNHIHDYKLCKCGAVGIDGGIFTGNRIIGNILDMETRAVYCSFTNKKQIWLPQEVIEMHFAKHTAAVAYKETAS